MSFEQELVMSAAIATTPASSIRTFRLYRLLFLYMISVPSHDGREFSAYLALPAAGRGPGIVVLQESFGVNHNMRDACDWFAARGFVALFPDLYCRIEPGVEAGQLDVQL